MGKFTPLPTSTIGDPDCKYCKRCSQYKVCFSGMKGFPKTSSNFGRGQAGCASHEDGCGVKHYDHQSTLADFYDHSSNSMNLESDTSTEVIKK